MSAGLIPLIRPAWPSDSGRTRSNFSRASARSWGIALVVEIGGDPLVLESAKSLDLLGLAADVAVVLGLDRDLVDHVRRQGRRRSGRGRAPADRSRSFLVGASDWKRVSPPTRVRQSRSRSSPIASRRDSKPSPAQVVDQSDLPAQLGEPQVGVVVPEHQPILGAAGEHPIRLVDSAGDQVVDQDADIRPRAIEDQRRLVADAQAPR